MSEPPSVSDKRGVVRRPIITKGGLMIGEIPKPTRNEYLAFALANKRKSWARRWLRTNYAERFL